MGFREVLQGSAVDLTEADRRIGAILLGDRRGAPLYTAAQLAQRAEVHESTVVRFAQKLGYSGYLAMRVDLASDSLGGDDERALRRPGGDESSLARVIRGQIEVLERVEEHVSQAVIDDAMAALLAATRVFVVSNGIVGPLGDFFARKIALLGIPSIVVHQTGAELGVQLATVKPGDIVLFFALSGEYEVIQPFERQLMRLGVKVVLVSDQPVLTYRPGADFVLAAPRSDLNYGVFVVLATIAYAMDYSLSQQLADRR